MSNGRLQSEQEEKFNAITHAIGILLAIIFLPFLLFKAQEKLLVLFISYILFSLGFISTYLSSTLYHLVKDTVIKNRLRVWDHISIFILIGGSYSPVVFTYLKYESAVLFMSIMWCLITLTAILKIFFTGRFNLLSTILYLAVGWMAIFIIEPIMDRMPLYIFWWILAGGLSYSLGVIFYRWKKLKYHHGYWHIFVLLGTICHLIALWMML